MVGLPDGEKNFEDTCNRLDSIPACDRRTDIVPRHSPRYVYASRGKNEMAFLYTKNQCWVQMARRLCMLWQDVYPSVRRSVCHTSIFCRNGSTYHQKIQTHDLYTLCSKVISSDLVKYLMTWSIARCLCDSWACKCIRCPVFEPGNVCCRWSLSRERSWCSRDTNCIFVCATAGLALRTLVDSAAADSGLYDLWCCSTVGCLHATKWPCMHRRRSVMLCECVCSQ